MQPYRRDIENELVRSAQLYAQGDTEGGFRTFQALRPQLAHLPRLEGWPATRYAILAELDRNELALLNDRPMFDALARATLADDSGALDDLVDERMRKNTAIGVQAFAGTPHLEEAYRGALDFAYERGRVRRRAQSGVVFGLVLLVLIARKIVLAYVLVP